MFRTFIFGIVSGIAIFACLLYFVPAVNQHREASLVTVQANGGNTETFLINLPEDRILYGAASASAVPAGLSWPELDLLAGTQTELFKIRNRNDVVVGIASRIAGSRTAAASIVEWTLYLPARGSLYVSLQPESGDAGFRSGSLVAGTREFAGLSGSVTENFIAANRRGEGEGNGSAAQIELVTALVGIQREVE